MLWTYITLFKRINTHIVIPRKSSIGGNLPKFLPHPNIPSQIWSTACSIPTGIIQSCSPFTVGASQEPIRLVVERKLEKVWLRVIEPAFPFHVPLSLALFLTHRHTYAYANTHFQRHTHTCRGQERELPWETEAWVKEGCWQWKGLTHLLATWSLSPSSNALKRTVQQCRAKHSGWSLDPCTCLHGGKGDRPCMCLHVLIPVGVCVKVARNLNRGIRFFFFCFRETKRRGREKKKKNPPSSHSPPSKLGLQSLPAIYMQTES